MRKDWTGGDGQRNEEGGACQTGCHKPYRYDREKPVANADQGDENRRPNRGDEERRGERMERQGERMQNQGERMQERGERKRDEDSHVTVTERVRKDFIFRPEARGDERKA